MTNYYSGQILSTDSDYEKNLKLKSMTNDQVMAIVKAEVKIKKHKEEKPFIEWSDLLKTKLVNSTKF